MLFRSVGDIPMLSLVGGKWTSFRAFSEQVTDRVLSMMQKNRKGSTADLPVRGGDKLPLSEQDKKAYADNLSKKYGFTAEYAHQLLMRYGTYAEKIAAYIKDTNGKPLKSIANWNSGEFDYILEIEKPLHLDDVFVRRSTIAWLGNASDDVIEEFSDIMAKKYGWNAGKRKEEIERLKKVLAE